MAKFVLITNAIFTSDKTGKPQAVACRVRATEEEREKHAKTIKISPHLFAGNLPLPGEAVYAEFDEANLRDSGNYKVLSNAKILSIGVPPVEAKPETTQEAAEDTTTPF